MVFWCLRFPPKNKRKQVDLRYHSSKVEFLRSFFGGNWIHQKPFRNYLTFNTYAGKAFSLKNLIRNWKNLILFCSLYKEKSYFRVENSITMWEKIGNIIAVSHSVLGCSRIWFTVAAILCTTDCGHPMNPFFIEIPHFWAWADNLGR